MLEAQVSISEGSPSFSNFLRPDLEILGGLQCGDWHVQLRPVPSALPGSEGGPGPKP